MGINPSEYIGINYKDVLKYFCRNYQIYLTIDKINFVLFGDHKNKYQEMNDHKDCLYFIARDQHGDYIPSYKFQELENA